MKRLHLGERARKKIQLGGPQVKKLHVGKTEATKFKNVPWREEARLKVSERPCCQH